MKLTVLTENVAGGQLLAEHGLSYLIEIDSEKILLDAGHSDVFLKNANKIEKNLLDDVNTVVLSHGHWDHGNGLKYLNNKTLITHSSAFIKRYRKNDKSNIGLELSKSDLEQKFNIVLSNNPYEISNNVFFLGGIPRLNNFESQTSPFIDENGNPDFVPDDSALAIIQNNEIVVVTGCSHSGICNIIEYAKKVCGINKVKAVIGGFHLKFNNLQTKKTIQYLKNNDIENVYPSHCTDLPALSAFYNAFEINQVKTGMVFKF